MSLQTIAFNTIHKNLHNYDYQKFSDILYSTRNNKDIINELTQYMYTDNKLDILIKILKENSDLYDHIYYNMFKSLLKNMQISDYFLLNLDYDHTKFNKFTYNLFGDDFNWNNCIVSGGLLSKIVFEMNPNHFLFKSSDIDLYLYGEIKDKKIKLNYIIQYFKTKFNSDIILVNRRNIIELYFRGIERKVQIICTNYFTPLEIIYNFDTSHVQIIYNGKQFLATKYFIQTFDTKIVKCFKDFLKDERIYKILKLGLQLDLSNSPICNTIKVNPEFIDKIINSDEIEFKLQNYYYPKSDDSLSKIKFELLIHNIIKVKEQINNYNYIINWDLVFDFKNQTDSYFNMCCIPDSNSEFNNLDINFRKYGKVEHRYGMFRKVLYFNSFRINNTNINLSYKLNYLMRKDQLLNRFSSTSISICNYNNKLDDLIKIINNLVKHFKNYDYTPEAIEAFKTRYVMKFNDLNDKFNFSKIKFDFKKDMDGNIWFNPRISSKTRWYNHINQEFEMGDIKSSSIINKFKKQTLNLEINIQLQIDYLYNKKITNDTIPEIKLFVSRIKFLNL